MKVAALKGINSTANVNRRQAMLIGNLIGNVRRYPWAQDIPVLLTLHHE